MEPCILRQPHCGSQKGSVETGLNLTDRRQSETKRHLVVDHASTPLGVRLSAATSHLSLG